MPYRPFKVPPMAIWWRHELILGAICLFLCLLSRSMAPDIGLLWIAFGMFGAIFLLMGIVDFFRFTITGRKPDLSNIPSVAAPLYEASIKAYQFGRYDDALKYINGAIERAQGEIPEFSTQKYLISLALEEEKSLQGEIELGKGWAVGLKDQKRYHYIVTDRRVVFSALGNFISTIDFNEIEVWHMNNHNYSIDIITKYYSRSYTMDKENFEALSAILSQAGALKDKLIVDNTSPEDEPLESDDKDIT